MLKDYVARKATGRVSVARVGVDVYNLVIKRFDPDTGQELQPTVIGCDTKSVDEGIVAVEAKVLALQDELAALQAMKTDFAALEAAGQAQQLDG
jgi:hypothetical protein